MLRWTMIREFIGLVVASGTLYRVFIYLFINLTRVKYNKLQNS